MKYGETIFDSIYLLFTIIAGIYILVKGKNKTSKLMGFAALILGLGDAFHLVPRMLNYFIDKDLNMYLGIGKLITSLTMTIFYLLIYYVYVYNYKASEEKIESIIVWLLAITRIILCLLPQNNWLSNSSPYNYGIIRNIPFILLGITIIIFYFKNRELDKSLKFIYLFILLSFLFYIPVVVSTMSTLGMLMIPKTLCYIFIIISFIIKVKGEQV